MNIQQLETELLKITNPKVLVFPFGKITNHNIFIEIHLSYLKSNKGNKRYMPYYNRLIAFYEANK